MKYKTLEPRSKFGEAYRVGDAHSLERRFGESQSLERKAGDTHSLERRVGDTHSLERRRRLPNVPRDVPSHSLPRYTNLCFKVKIHTEKSAQIENFIGVCRLYK